MMFMNSQDDDKAMRKQLKEGVSESLADIEVAKSFSFSFYYLLKSLVDFM